MTIFGMVEQAGYLRDALVVKEEAGDEGSDLRGDAAVTLQEE